MKTNLLGAAVLLAFSFIACNNQNKPHQEAEKAATNEEQIAADMKSFISLFEIPAADISRAITFYEAILGIDIEKMEIPGMEMGIFPYEGQMVTGVIMKAEGYQPSADGTTMYLDAGNNLQDILDKVEENGGKIILPKTAHADENGFFALFLDTEGNKLGLNSPN